MKAILTDSSGLSEGAAHFVMETSNEPKEEVASGLVVRKPLDDDEREFPVISGESYRAGGVACRWDSELTSAQLFRGVEIPDELESIGGFIGVFNGFVESQKETPLNRIITPAADVAKRMTNAVNEYRFDKDSGKRIGSIKEIDVEPLFITGLKSLLNLEREAAECQQDL